MGLTWPEVLARLSRRESLSAAEAEDTLTWGGVIVHNRRWARTRAELMPRVLRYRSKLLVRALPAPITERVEAAVRARRRDPA